MTRFHSRSHPGLRVHKHDGQPYDDNGVPDGDRVLELRDGVGDRGRDADHVCHCYGGAHGGARAVGPVCGSGISVLGKDMKIQNIKKEKETRRDKGKGKEIRPMLTRRLAYACALNMLVKCGLATRGMKFPELEKGKASSCSEGVPTAWCIR